MLRDIEKTLFLMNSFCLKFSFECLRINKLGLSWAKLRQAEVKPVVGINWLLQG